MAVDDAEFALHLSDIRLVQTLRLIEVMMNDHPDQQAVERALEAISSARESIGKLRTASRPSEWNVF